MVVVVKETAQPPDAAMVYFTVYVPPVCWQKVYRLPSAASAKVPAPRIGYRFHPGFPV